MSFRTNEDNIFQTGTTITAKENPTLRLMIVTYYQRIYYCVPVNTPDARQLAYFERELISPAFARETLW